MGRDYLAQPTSSTRKKATTPPRQIIMPTLSGLYTSISGRTLTINDRDQLTLLPRGAGPKDADKLRVDGESWLCRNDGVSNDCFLAACRSGPCLRADAIVDL